MNNSMFGKTMENLRKQRKIDLVNNRESLRKRIMQPSFINHQIFHENLVAIERKKTNLILNRPIYIGLCVLDLSKVLMYFFHYFHIKKMYPGEKSRLLFTDTDSLTYSIKTEDIYKDLNSHSHLYDFSGYPKEHFCFSDSNKKIIGKFKDELNGLPMEEFIGLKAKMYSVKYFKNGQQIDSKKAKGVKKCVVKKKLTHEDFKASLFANQSFYRYSTAIRSHGHKVYSIKQNKKALSSYDDKRYILQDGITSLPYGHFRIGNL